MIILYSGWYIDSNKKSSVANENGDSYFENQKKHQQQFQQNTIGNTPKHCIISYYLQKRQKWPSKCICSTSESQFFNEATVYQIIHTLYGNYCHSNAGQPSQLEEMGSDACVFVGYHDKVSNTNSMNKLFETWIICSKSIFSLTPWTNYSTLG